MNAKTKTLSCASIRLLSWAALCKPAIQRVCKLQRRIAKAVSLGKWNRVKVLQGLLVHSFSARTLAVLNVTSNKGGKTPGVDKVVWKTDNDKINAVFSLRIRGYKAQPLRRIYIPKKDKTKLRPLSIPTMHDRAMQALFKLALEPIAETFADLNSYGFRKFRSCADAIEAAFNKLCHKYDGVWVLEADIKSCFDQISHQWLLANIPMDKRILSQWLKAGYIENYRKFNTQAGTPQGGIISPLLMNMTLDGMEKAIRLKYPHWKRSKVHLIRYADDFIITAPEREILENEVKPMIENFLHERGLQLSPEKTHITHIDKGFDFLSQNLRKYRGTLLIKPAKAAVKAFKQKIKETFRKFRGHSAVNLITKLNPIIRGWANYHRHIVSKKTFWKLSKYIFDKTLRWAKSEHPGKKINWISRKYFTHGERQGRFSVLAKGKDGKLRVYQLYAIGLVPIRRHTKIKSDMNPFNPEHDKYFAKRRKENAKLNLVYRQKCVHLYQSKTSS